MEIGPEPAEAGKVAATEVIEELEATEEELVVEQVEPEVPDIHRTHQIVVVIDITVMELLLGTV